MSSNTEIMGNCISHELERIIETQGAENAAAYLMEQTFGICGKARSASFQAKLGLSSGEDMSFMEDFVFPARIFAQGNICDLAASCEHMINMPPNEVIKEAIENAVINICDEIDSENDAFVMSTPK